MKKLIPVLVSLVALLVCSRTVALAGNKSDRQKPQWVVRSLPASKSGTYVFVRGHGEERSLQAARQMAFVSMSQCLESEHGLVVNTNVHIAERMSQTRSSTSSSMDQEITLDVTEKGHRISMVCREIDEYWIERKGKYEVDVLYTVADRNVYGGSYDDTIVVTAKYGAAGLMSVVPGAGQIYKGSVVKGSLIIAGEVAAVGGIVLCENTRASYIKKMHEQPKYASQYNSLADSWRTGRNVSIGVAGAIYVYNLIDALVSTGAKRVVVKNNNLKVAPYADAKCVGVGLSFKF